MEIKPLIKDKYSEWDAFCLKSDDAWFWHTTPWIEYTLNYKPELKPVSKSFFVYHNNKITAICPLFIEEKRFKNEKIKEISFGGDYGPAPALANDLTKKEREKCFKMIFGHIDTLAKQNNVKRALIRFCPLSKSYIGRNIFNYLLKFGYFDCTFNTQILDLSKSLDELRKDIRHGHDAAIGSANKKLTVEIYDKDNIVYEIFEKYRELHHKAAGRVTRPKRTFDIMFELIKKDMAFLVGAKMKGGFVGFSYFIKYKNKVYYGSACNDAEFEKIGIGHLIQWNAIRWMKERDIIYNEIGVQKFFNELTEPSTDKEINISFYKRGFGGFTIPVFRGEKYYDKEYFVEIFKQRMEKCANCLDRVMLYE
jgi:hypothetical protein